MTRFQVVLLLGLCAPCIGCRREAEQTAQIPNESARPSVEVPRLSLGELRPEDGLSAIRIVRREPLLPHSPLVYDDFWRAYKPPFEPRPRTERTLDHMIRPGLDEEEAKAMIFKQILGNVSVKKDELRIRDVQLMHRGSKCGWSIEYEQVFRAPVIERDFNVFGVKARVFRDDDWDIDVNLCDIMVEQKTARPVLSKEAAKRLARTSLHVGENTPHSFEQLEIAYLPDTESEGRFIPVWQIEIHIPVDPATVKSYRWAHHGGEVGINAWTGAIVSGDPLWADWFKDPAHWDELQEELAGWGSDVPVATRDILDRVRCGASESEVDDILRPIMLATSYTPFDLSGGLEKLYHIRGNKQLRVVICGLWCNEKVVLRKKVVHIGPFELKRAWYGHFAPTDDEAKKATQIALAQLKRDLAEGTDHRELHEISTPWQVISSDLPELTVELDADRKGERKQYTVTVVGRYVTHRLVELDFACQDRFEFHLTVDLEDEVVVRTKWQPSPQDIEQARSIADPTLKDFFGSDRRNKVKVTASGEYDFGPTRRCVFLSYEKPSPNGGTVSCGAMVELDNQRLRNQRLR